MKAAVTSKLLYRDAEYADYLVGVAKGHPNPEVRLRAEAQLEKLIGARTEERGF